MVDRSRIPEAPADLEQRSTAVVEALVTEAGVTPPDALDRRFGSSALKVDGKIFAMLVRGHLVVKLPRDRVQALIHDGTGGPFSAGKGTPMKEWLTVLSVDDDTWLALAREALAVVGRQTPP
ncbi:MAG: hypothetical protein NVS4B2_28860 [Chloroflexota bacterium]